ncbi:MAG: hypothetical protein ACTSQY_10165 [Candidatus Odinarchaeia archaeon]
MNDMKFTLLSIFNELDAEINMSTFDNRMIFQKEIYLLQESGLSLGFSFGWYRRGPYSSFVADQGFQLSSVELDASQLPELDADEIASIDRYRTLVDDAIAEFGDHDHAFVLELLASLHFIIKYGYPRPDTIQDAITILNYKKPRFEGYGELAAEILERHGLIT